MALETKVGTCKNLFCRDTSWKLINNIYGRDIFVSCHGARLRNCSFGDTCRGAHSEEEIHTLPHINAFNMMDKSKLNLVKIYNNIVTVFEESKSEVINSDFKTRLSNYKNLNFVEILNLWFDITCYHRKIKKEMKNDVNFESEFKNIKKIPEFYLDDEDTVWSLERITKLCPKHQDLIAKINNEKEKPNIWDICLASINCKTGCHNPVHMVCNDDLMEGRCSCMSKDEFDDKKSKLNEEIRKNKQLLNPEGDFELSKITKKKKQSIIRKINSLQKELNGMSRKIHFTEEGMKPFSKQMEEYKEELQKMEDSKIKEVADRKTEMTKVAKKKVSKPVF